MNTWDNGARADVVKKIIDTNFQELSNRIDETAHFYVKNFKTSDWDGNTIFISHAESKKLNPCVNLYIKTNTGYSVVEGGFEIVNGGVELQTDIPYEGRVVIR